MHKSLIYIKIAKIQTPSIVTVDDVTMQYIKCLQNIYGTANSAGPDQIAPLGSLICVCPVFSHLIVPILRTSMEFCGNKDHPVETLITKILNQ